MRLFLAVWPSPEVVDTLRALPRPDIAGVRWTTEDQWHVTLRFLGESELADGIAALDAAAEGRATTAVMGPATARLGRRVLMVPVAGLEHLVEVGHLTLARGKRGVPASLAGTPVTGEWPVEEVTLVQSRLHPKGARYEVLERRTLVR